MINVWRHVNTFRSTDCSKKAIINYNRETECYFIDFYDNDVYIDTRQYQDKSIYWVEDAAENYTLGILNV